MSLNSFLVEAKAWNVFDFEDGDQADWTSGQPVRLFRLLDMFITDKLFTSTLRLYDATTASGTPVIEIGSSDYPAVWSAGLMGLRFDNGLSIEWNDASTTFQNGDKFLLVYQLER